MKSAMPENQMPEEQVCGPYTLDIHRVVAADRAELALHRIRTPEPSRSAPVILLHGSYSRRNFWLSDKGVGFGAHLSDAGYDVWIPELRGHGLSPKGERFSRITAEDQIRHDLPAIENRVREANGRPRFWIGHSFGGMFILAAFAARVIGQDGVSGLVTFGSQISRGDTYLKIPPVALALKTGLRLLGHFPAPALGLGPEIESAGTMIEIIRWKALGGRWTDSKGFDYWAGLRSVTVPFLCLAAAADHNDPPEGCRMTFDQVGSPDRTYLLLGKETGFSIDYDHVGMVVGKTAPAEVWPRVTEWLDARR